MTSRLLVYVFPIGHIIFPILKPVSFPPGMEKL
jgi:hypothetical protein